jgi:pantetheine-phosphate adenylyltransferase
MAEPAAARIAVFPGSFDPLTNGHIDIIRRGAKLFDRIWVAVLTNAGKTPLFTIDERLAIIRENFKDHSNVEADTFDGLVVDYARTKHATVLVRGLRGIADFEYELQMAMMNRHLDASIETVFMMPAEQYTYVSSRLIKEVMALGGSITGLVPPGVERRLMEKKGSSTK